MHFNNDPFEEQVQFDDMLKFWYDPERVPRMPLAANKRRSLERPEIKITKKRKKVKLDKYFVYFNMSCSSLSNYYSQSTVFLSGCRKGCFHVILVFWLRKQLIFTKQIDFFFADVFVYILPQLYKEHLKSLFNLVTGEMFGYFGAIIEEKMAFKNC